MGSHHLSCHVTYPPHNPLTLDPGWQEVEELRKQVAASKEVKGKGQEGKGEEGGDTKLKRDSDLFELRLAKDQAQAKASIYIGLSQHHYGFGFRFMT